MLKKQEKIIGQAHRTDLKNVKNLVIQESIAFVKQSQENVTQLLCREHSMITR